MSKRALKNSFLFVSLLTVPALRAAPELHGRFTDQERLSLADTLASLKSRRIQLRNWDYFVDQRIGHYIPESIDPLDSLTGAYGKLSVVASDANAMKGPAQNLSFLYFHRLLHFADIPDVALNLGSKPTKISLDQANVGVVRLFSPFFKSRYRLKQAGILVHEARHSDCPDGMEDGLKAKLQNTTDPKLVADALGESTCTYPHAVCPEGHDYEGQRICDAQVWGANAAELAYYRDLLVNCAECSDEEKEIAKILAFDRANLVLDLQGFYEKSGEWKDFRPRDP